MSSLTWERASIADLPRLEERLSFLYVDRCAIHRDDSGVEVRSERGEVHFPAALVSTLLCGPGTRATHAAMTLLADSGCGVGWVGERVASMSSFGRALNGSTELLRRQAALVSNPLERLEVARQMYAARFGDPETRLLTLEALRGMEGKRVKALYAELSEEYGIPWTRRTYRPRDPAASDPINQALSYAHSVLYAIVSTAVLSLGLSPGLGFVHTGGPNSFIHDVADLYKAEVSIPAAFQAVAARPDDLLAEVRQRLRRSNADFRLLSRCSADLRRMFGDQAIVEDVTGFLWDGKFGTVSAGKNYEEF